MAMHNIQQIPSNTRTIADGQTRPSRPSNRMPARGLDGTTATGAGTRQRATLWDCLLRLARTPKGYLLLALSALLILTVPHQGPEAIKGTLAAVAAAAAADIVLSLVLRYKLIVPTSALLTGLIVGMVISPQEPINTIAAVAVLAIALKHLLRTVKAHIFNPAVPALAIAPPLFGTGESWWGATAGLPVPAVVPLLIAGILVADRANKTPQVLTFLGVYFALITTMAYQHLGDPTRIAALYRDPFLNSVLFFAFFMLTDPPTSPARFKDQVIFGAGVALAAVAIEMSRDTVTYLLLALLPGNAWWAWRRLMPKRGPGTKPARLTNRLGTLDSADH